MTTNQPNSIETRLTRLETLFTNMGETVLSQNDAIAAVNANLTAQSATIDVLVATIQQLTENVAAVNQRVDSLAEQAAQDRQQAAIDRQEFRTEIRQIWEYLRDRNGPNACQEWETFTESLGNGIELEMVYIPGGSFIMGSPEDEKDSHHRERPQHQVTVQPFYMGKFQITQAQWKAVANMPKIERDLTLFYYSRESIIRILP